MAAFALTAPAVGHARCFDVSRGEPHALTGVLAYVMFAGPPNYSDIRQGDTPEPQYVLRLLSPICITGDDFADPKVSFTAVQLGSSAEVSRKLKSSLNHQVTVTLRDAMGAETGHHHEPLVAFVTSVRPAQQQQKLDFVDEYGTAATTIRGFYTALSDGQGQVASQFIIPEKRTGPFAPAALSRFYGALSEPIRLIDISESGPSDFTAHYTFRSRSGVCKGRATIHTEMRQGHNLIASIHALNGC